MPRAATAAAAFPPGALSLRLASPVETEFTLGPIRLAFPASG